MTCLYPSPHRLAGWRSLVALRAFAGGLALLTLGCAGEKVTTKSSPQLSQYLVRSVVVLPFHTLATPQVTRRQVTEPLPTEGALKSDIEMIPGRSAQRPRQDTAAVPQETGDKIARMFSRKLRHKGGLTVHSPAEAAIEIVNVKSVDEDLKMEEEAKRVAVRLKADAALVGLVRVYQERVGSKYGAVPAAVGFEVMLVARDGRKLWAGSYYEKQRPATEDFDGFWKRGFGFVTAQELAEYGVEQLLGEFPYGS